MANWQVISLDTTTPQLRAPGTGDGYSFNSGSTQLGVWTTAGLGIDTASPTSGYKLDVNGSMQAASTASNFIAARFLAASGGPSNIALLRAGYAAWYIGSRNNDTAFNITITDTTHATPNLTITQAGNVGIGTASPAHRLYVATSAGFVAGFQTTAAADHRPVGWFNSAGSLVGDVGLDITNTLFKVRAVGMPLVFGSGADGTDRMRLDSSGRLLLGTTTSITSWSSGRAMDLQIATISSNYPGLSAYSYSSSVAAGGMLITGRSRGAFGVLSTTNSGDALGYLSFEGVNTANTAVAGAYIKGAQDGAAGAVNIPGRIEFYVSTGSADPQERMRLDASGNLAVGTSTARGDLDVSSGNTPTSVTKSIHLGYSAANFYGFRLANTNAAGSFAAGTFSIQRGTTAAWNDDFVINDSGNVGIGTSSPVAKLQSTGGVLASGAVAATVANAAVMDFSGGLTRFWATGSNTSTQGSMVFVTASSNASVYNERMLLDSSGNLGLGVTPSAWDTSAFRTLQVGSGPGSAALFGRTDNANYVGISVNYYYGAGNHRYVANGHALYYTQQNGVHSWHIAPSNTSGAGAIASFTQAMTLNASGNLGVGTTSPSAKLSVSSGNIFVDNANGSVIIRNADATNQQQIRVRMSGNDGVLDVTRASGTAPNLIFGTEALERARIDSSGNVVVNTAAVATTATDGFLYIPTCAGAPTGVPTTFTGRSPLVVDSTNNRFYVYVNGAWKYATLT